MARVFSFYEFSVDHLRQQFGSASEAVLSEFDARFEKKIAAAPTGDFGEGIRARSKAARAILTGESQVPDEEVESGSLTALVHDALSLNPQLKSCPNVDDFVHALSQIFCFPNPDIDGSLLTHGPQQRRVGRYLHSGRPFFGNAFPDDGRHGLYGWLSGEDEVPALSAIVGADVWREYTLSGRFKSDRRAAFHEQRATFDEWLGTCATRNQDIFFTSHAIESWA